MNVTASAHWKSPLGSLYELPGGASADSSGTAVWQGRLGGSDDVLLVYTSLYKSIVRSVRMSEPTGISPELQFERQKRTERSEMTISAARLPPTLAESIREQLEMLFEALDEEGLVIDMQSARSAFRFLNEAAGLRAPQIALTDSGYIYLQWAESHKILGIIFKPDETCVWSAAKPNEENLKQRLSESGIRSVSDLPDFLKLLAPWISDETWRRAS